MEMFMRPCRQEQYKRCEALKQEQLGSKAVRHERIEVPLRNVDLKLEYMRVHKAVRQERMKYAIRGPCGMIERKIWRIRIKIVIVA